MEYISTVKDGKLWFVIKLYYFSLSLYVVLPQSSVLVMLTVEFTVKLVISVPSILNYISPVIDVASDSKSNKNAKNLNSTW